MGWTDKPFPRYLAVYYLYEVNMISQDIWYLNLYEGQRVKSNENLNINVDYYKNIDSFQDFDTFDTSITISPSDEIIVLQPGEFYFEDNVPFRGNSFQGKIKNIQGQPNNSSRIEVERNPLFLILKDQGYLYFAPIEILNQSYFSPVDV